jgi:hypothetical protein
MSEAVLGGAAVRVWLDPCLHSRRRSVASWRVRSSVWRDFIRSSGGDRDGKLFHQPLGANLKLSVRKRGAMSIFQRA